MLRSGYHGQPACCGSGSELADVPVVVRVLGDTDSRPTTPRRALTVGGAALAWPRGADDPG